MYERGTFATGETKTGTLIDYSVNILSCEIWDALQYLCEYEIKNFNTTCDFFRTRARTIGVASITAHTNPTINSFSTSQRVNESIRVETNAAPVNINNREDDIRGHYEESIIALLSMVKFCEDSRSASKQFSYARKPDLIECKKVVSNVLTLLHAYLAHVARATSPTVNCSDFKKLTEHFRSNDHEIASKAYIARNINTHADVGHCEYLDVLDRYVDLTVSATKSATMWMEGKKKGLVTPRDYLEDKKKIDFMLDNVKQMSDALDSCYKYFRIFTGSR